MKKKGSKLSCHCPNLTAICLIVISVGGVFLLNRFAFLLEIALHVLCDPYFLNVEFSFSDLVL